MISTKVLLHKSTLKVKVDLLMHQSGAEYFMEVVCIEDKNTFYFKYFIKVHSLYEIIKKLLIS